MLKKIADREKDVARREKRMGNLTNQIPEFEVGSKSYQSLKDQLKAEETLLINAEHSLADAQEELASLPAKDLDGTWFEDAWKELQRFN